MLIGGTTTIGGKTFEDWFKNYLMYRVGEYWLPTADVYDVKLVATRFVARRLDDLVYDPQWKFSGREIAGLKIDVEGHEFDAIKGAGRLLTEHKPLVMVETTDVPTMSDVMSSFGYSHFERHDDKLRPIVTPHYNAYFVHRDRMGRYAKAGLVPRGPRRFFGLLAAK